MRSGHAAHCSRARVADGKERRDASARRAVRRLAQDTSGAVVQPAVSKSVVFGRMRQPRNVLLSVM